MERGSRLHKAPGHRHRHLRNHLIRRTSCQLAGTLSSRAWRARSRVAVVRCERLLRVVWVCWERLVRVFARLVARV